MRARIGEDQLRPRPVGVGAARADEGGPRRCSTAWFRRICISPGCLTRWRASTRSSSCRRRPRRGRPTGPHPRRAAVSSYGVSGTNVHAIVEQAPEHGRRRHARPRRDRGPLLFALSSTSAEELRRTAGRLADWVQTHDERRACRIWRYTLARRRAHRPVRTAVIAADRPELVAALRAGRRRRRSVSGQRSARTTVDRCGCSPGRVRSGLRWVPNCSRNEPVFAATVARMEPLIAGESGFSVTEAMTAPEMVTGIDRVQPTLFAMQVALAATMKALRGAAGRGDRAFDGRGRRGGGRRRAVAGRRRAGHLPPLAADGHASPGPVRWPRWSCRPSRCSRS